MAQAVTDDHLTEYARDVKYARDAQYREWLVKMPRLKFPSSWEVTISPPFGGAAVRFRAHRGKAEVSVYADFDNSLGFYPQPYWEVYPYEDDVYRCALSDTDDLIAAIESSLVAQEEEKQ